MEGRENKIKRMRREGKRMSKKIGKSGKRVTEEEEKGQRRGEKMRL